MKTRNQAAALIQARWKGRSYRRQRLKYEKVVIKLQAYQRGRSVRKEFVKFRAFCREQKAFEIESKARRERIWQQQQQLLYMETISPDQYTRIMQWRRQRAAKLIQRRWKEYLKYHPRVHPYLWDEYDDNGDDIHKWDVISDESSVSSSVGEVPLVDPQTYLTRKHEFHQRIKLNAQHFSTKNPWKLRPGQNASKSDMDHARLEMFKKLQIDKRELHRRLRIYEEAVRLPMRDKTVNVLFSRLDKRLRAVQSPPPIPLIDMGNELLDSKAPITPLPKSKSRCEAALRYHDATVQSIINSTKPWHMPIAGEQYDMREKSIPSWDIEGNGQKVWSWPQQPHLNSDVPNYDVNDDHVLQFLGKANPDAKKLPSHAWLHYAEYQTEGTLIPCMTSNPLLMNCTQQKLDRIDDTFGETFSSQVRSKARHRVGEIKNQIQFNTHMRSMQNESVSCDPPPVKAEPKVADQIGSIDYGGLRRNYMATRIQRRVRGNVARQHVQEMRANYFVMVRGRAIRRGLCEECGEQQAVLKCEDCQECVQFCPACWVHVHSTRRRKTHVPVPLVIDQTKAQVPEPFSYESKSFDSKEKISSINPPVSSTVVATEIEDISIPSSNVLSADALLLGITSEANKPAEKSISIAPARKKPTLKQRMASKKPQMDDTQNSPDLASVQPHQTSTGISDSVMDALMVNTVVCENTTPPQETLQQNLEPTSESNASVALIPSDPS